VPVITLIFVAIIWLRLRRCQGLHIARLRCRRLIRVAFADAPSPAAITLTLFFAMRHDAITLIMPLSFFSAATHAVLAITPRFTPLLLRRLFRYAMLHAMMMLNIALRFRLFRRRCCSRYAFAIDAAAMPLLIYTLIRYADVDLLYAYIDV